MRVFYRSTAPAPGTNDLSTTDGPPVPQEALIKLGLKVEALGTGSEGQARAHAIAKSSGHQTPEGFKLVFSELDEDKYQIDLALDLRLTRAASSVLFKHQFQALILSGKTYVDVEDSTTNQWIRVDLIAGDFISFPPNCLVRVGMDLEEGLRKLSAIISLSIEKGDLDAFFSNTHMAFGEDITKHRSNLLNLFFKITPGLRDHNCFPQALGDLGIQTTNLPVISTVGTAVLDEARSKLGVKVDKFGTEPESQTQAEGFKLVFSKL
ncbi:hypothetical protein L218DRAFT_951932 [Marasmius fiardii PR-910]|nr:hypothetical protein L218DRAFT_951932 [Marasmius fiardii PR-910]